MNPGVNIVHGDQINQTGAGVIIGKIQQSSPEPEQPGAARRKKVVLMLMSNPRGTTPVRLDEEHRAVEHAILAGRNRDQLDLRVSPAARYTDLHDALVRYEPTVVHFSGHGSPDGGIILADERGRPLPVAQMPLGEAFKALGSSVQCVVLNACLTEDQAAIISAHVPCVVGMSREILDADAVDFAGGFYRALADGQSVRSAFDLGVNTLALRGRARRTQPVLMARPDVATRLFITA